MIFLLSNFVYKSIDTKQIEARSIINVLADIGTDVNQLIDFEDIKNLVWNESEACFKSTQKNHKLDKHYTNFIIENNAYKCKNNLVEQIVRLQAAKKNNLSMFEACFNNDFVISLALTPNISHLSCSVLLTREIALFTGISHNEISNLFTLPTVVEKATIEEQNCLSTKKWQSFHKNIQVFHIANCLQIEVKEDFVFEVLCKTMNVHIEKTVLKDKVLLKSEKLNELLPFCLSFLLNNYAEKQTENINCAFVDRRIGKVSLSAFQQYFVSLSNVVVKMHKVGINVKKIDYIVYVDIPSFINIYDEIQYIEEIYRNCVCFKVETLNISPFYKSAEDIYTSAKKILLCHKFKEICSLPFSSYGVLCDNPCDKTNAYLRSTALLSFTQNMRASKNENVFQQGTLFFEIDDLIYSPRFLSMCEVFTQQQSFIDSILFYVSSQCFKKGHISIKCNKSYNLIDKDKSTIHASSYTVYISKLPLYIYSTFVFRGTLFKCLELNLSLLSQLNFFDLAHMFITKSDTLNSSFCLTTYFYEDTESYLKYLIDIFYTQKRYAEMYDSFATNGSVKITLRLYDI